MGNPVSPKQKCPFSPKLKYAFRRTRNGDHREEQERNQQTGRDAKTGGKTYVSRQARQPSQKEAAGLISKQLGRKMKELDIPIICTNPPQAKGRVERVIQTLEVRLVMEMRLHGLITPGANSTLSTIAHMSPRGGDISILENR
jgi:hypothetical protein